MDAEQVWRLWRRLLRDETLQKQLFGAQGTTQWLQHFAHNDRTILEAYASEFGRVRWFVENYQFRLVNSFINALETGAPLTLRALLNVGLDLPTLSKAFLREQAWFDYGPRVYSYCDAALGFLLRCDELSGHPQIRDLIGLERECVALYTGMLKVDSVAHGCYQRTRSARVYRSQHALSIWLRDKSQLGHGTLTLSNQDILIYLPTPTARHKFALISPRAASLYHFLEQPRSPASMAMVASPIHNHLISGEDMALLDRLRQLNAIRIPA